MMLKIWKYEVPVNGRHYDIDIPKGATIVHVGAQHSDTVSFWAIVDEHAPTEHRSFMVVGTGHAFPDNWRHVGSVLMEPFVWHLLEATLTEKD